MPRVLAICRDDEGVGGPCFAMERVAGRSVDDAPPAAYHSPGWFRDCQPARRRAIWESFHDQLAVLHRIDAGGLDQARHGEGGLRDVLHYWREALLDVVDAGQVPQQLAAFDWLTEHLPRDADDSPAVCMGDARLVNGLVDGDRVRALVDFEIAYVGNPAADIGYSLFCDRTFRQSGDQPIDDLPSPEETWQRWSDATGRPATHREYWEAFGGMILGVTASRAIVQWTGGDGTALRETMNPIIGAWQAAIRRAST